MPGSNIPIRTRKYSRRVQNKRLELRVEVNNIQGKAIGTEGLAQLVQSIWDGEGRNEGDIRLVLTDDRHIVQLHRQFLQKDGITDVIAFPLEEAEDTFEGEIYINIDQVFRNAADYAVTPEEEVRRVVAHGTLHFLGFRDKSAREKELMTARENHYLARW